MPSRAVRLALLLAGAAGGCDLFHGTEWATRCDGAPDAEGCGARGGSGSAAEGGGASATGGGTSGVGAAGGAGGGSAGDGGRGPAQPCDGVMGGVEHAGHCYLDLTRDTLTWTEASSVCDGLAAGLGQPAHLVVLDTPEELAFLVQAFLDPTSAVEDAWIGYVCDAALHPDVGDCYCPSGCVNQAELDSKRAAWTWIEGYEGAFVDWNTNDPSGDGRCVAVSLRAPGWRMVDRDCDSSTHLLEMVVRTYRVLCEINPG